MAESVEREQAQGRKLAEAESGAAQARRERDEAKARCELLRNDRERILDRLIEGERLRQLGAEGESLAKDEVDLASFIAEMRAEIMELRASNAPYAKPSAPSERPSSKSPYATSEEAAELLASQGRIGISDGDRELLRGAAGFETCAEETLFSVSLRELAAPVGATRARAAKRLEKLNPKAALPALAAALKNEQEQEPLCALLDALCAAGDHASLPLVEERLGDENLEVRLRALEAAFQLGGDPCLEGALHDGSPLLRRRAALLAAGAPTEGAARILFSAADDDDATVRRVALLGLGERKEPAARARLLEALDDRDATVRRSAAKALSPSLGPEVFALADLQPPQRRRELRLLIADQSHKVQSRTATPQASGAPRPSPTRAEIAPLSAARTLATPALAAPTPAAQADGSLQGEILQRVYSALRGLSEEELARGLSCLPGKAAAVAQELALSGRLIRKGRRYFVP